MRFRESNFATIAGYAEKHQAQPAETGPTSCPDCVPAVQRKIAPSAVGVEFEEPVFSVASRISLQKLLDVLLPFKQATLSLSSNQTLVHADRVLLLLFDKLKMADSKLSRAQERAVIDELLKRGTPLSTLLQYLLNAN